MLMQQLIESMTPAERVKLFLSDCETLTLHAGLVEYGVNGATPTQAIGEQSLECVENLLSHLADFLQVIKADMQAKGWEVKL